MDWSFATGDHANFTVHPVKKQGSSLCRILMDGPGTPEDTILDLVCAQISAARHSVRIMSPYFLPPHRLHGELVSAVLRGVDVSVILPGENNHRLVDWAMRHQMPMLADRGVKIYRQPPPFAHTKLLLIDGRIHPARLRQPRPPQPQPQLRAGHGSAGSPAGGTAQRLL